MRHLFGLLLCAVAACGLGAAEPLKALYITGGCCHDYQRQKEIIPAGVKQRANVEFTVVHAGGNGTRYQGIENSLYQKPDWAKGYDVVIHNECFADDQDLEYVERVLKPHREGVPAVVVHCTMHTFRALKTNVFREFLGVSSFGHGPQHPLDVQLVKPDHPILRGFPADWKTGPEELYAISQVFSNTTVLATAADKKKDASGQWVATERQHALIWVNTFGKGRVFGTTLAHNNYTFADPVFLDMFTRGLLWACDKLDDQGRPRPGYGPVK
ncbi:ThuA domain-containing protein [Fontisphaera persica]|uniref:ThuA domain-containing protein n=1 Tax=Fontisphaera persica TaxID=2974023 RepID=UPI0024BF94EC|nr:ThuA domain-containing protein [Fontisphaera persica]WCJ58785.1 ThuA domain-containing protein [Fontisphaera persica]